MIFLRFGLHWIIGEFVIVLERFFWSLVRFGGDLLSHVLRRSTIGVTALNGRVREGIGCFARAIATKPKKRHADFVPQTSVLFQIYAVFDSDVLLLMCSVRPLSGCYWIKSSLSSN